MRDDGDDGPLPRVTRNAKDFAGATLPVFDAPELLAAVVAVE